MKNIYYFNSLENIESFLSKFPPKNFDFVLIGSGVAAASICKHLLAKNKKILIIKKGSFFDPNLNYRNDIFSNRLPIKKNTRIVAYGGTSNIWSGAHCESEDFELDKRWNISLQNVWGIKYLELIKYYKLA